MRQIHRSSAESHTLQRFDADDPKGWVYGFDGSYAVSGFVCRQTGHPEPFQFCRQVQWKTCWQGMVIKPVVSSMRSKHTGQVGSSTRFGVGGGKGFRLLEAATEDDDEGVKGSWFRLGNVRFSLMGVSKVIDLTKTTWQTCACKKSVTPPGH